MVSEERLLTGRLGQEAAHHWADSKSFKLDKGLGLDDFSEESQGFFAVVAAEVVSLREEKGKVAGEEFVEEKGAVMTIGLA